MVYEISFGDIKFRYAYESSTNFADFFKHHHLQYEVLYIAQGQGSFIIESNLYNFSDKTIIIIPPGKFHVLQIPPQNQYERYVINFSEELFPPLLAKERELVVCKTASDELCRLFTKLHSYSERFPSELFYSLLKNFLNEFLILFFADAECEKLEKTDVPVLIKKAMEYIDNNLDKPLNIDAIASHLFVSKSYLNHLFKSSLHTGLMQFVRIKKMYAARKYLKSGVNAIQVATMLGYRNYSTFLRNYRAEFSDNPVRTQKSESDS